MYKYIKKILTICFDGAKMYLDIKRHLGERGDEVYQMILRISTELRDELKAEASKRGQTLTGLIKQILWEWAERKEVR